MVEMFRGPNGGFTVAEKERHVRWYEWSIRQPHETLDRVLRALETRLPGGWTKGTEGDHSGSLGWPQPKGHETVAVFTVAPTAESVGATLSLELRYGRELGGGRLSGVGPLHTRPRDDVQRIAALADDFLDRAIRPAAEACGVSVHRATLPDIFLDGLSFDVRDSLLAFDKKARRTLPLEWDESEAWQDFVIAAKRGPGNADYGLLAEWLRARGWPEPLAEELNTRFFDQRQLLDRYRDTLVIA